MWGHLIKLLSLGKGALVVGIAASAAVVSTAEVSNTPSHHEDPSPTPIVSVVPAAKPAEPTAKAKDEPKPLKPSKPSEPPKADDSVKPELSGVVKECVEKYAKLRAAGDSATPGDRESTTAVCKAAMEPKDTGLDAAIKQCLADWREYAEQSSAACAKALAASGLSPDDFWKKFEAWAVQQQGHEQDATVDVNALVKECFAKYTAHDPTTLETCKKAMAASGLSGDDFWNKYGRPTPPSAAPKSSTSDATYQLLTNCFKLHNALTSTSEPARVTAAYEACNKAIAATGLSAADFWAKFAKELAPAKPSPTATPKPVTNTAEVSQLIAKCLDLYKKVATTTDTKTVSDACKLAIQASGMTSADFWAKYHPATN